jgi:hypothetical protein
LGRLVVVMATLDFVAWMTTLYETRETCPPHPVTFSVKE